MNSNKLYFEIFEEFEKASGQKAKVDVLRKYETKAFKNFLCCALHPSITFDVKDIPTYKPAIEPAGLNYVYLEQEMNQMYKYITNHPAKPYDITEKRQRELLTVTLESLHRDEAEILVNMINKSLKVRGLNTKIVKEAFPELPFEV
jgi:hypothetical protein